MSTPLHDAINDFKARGLPVPFSEGTRYGYPLDVWNKMTPEAQQGAVEIFSFAFPVIAISEGAREALETGKVTPILKHKEA